MIINLYLPKANEADDEARQAVVFFPGIGAFYGHTSSQSPQPPQPRPLEFIPRAGRVLVAPVFWGSYERYAGLYELNAASRSAMQSELRRRWYTDLKRTIDYLETRDDIDAENFAYLGISYGASHALPILALEKRLDAAVLVAGGLGDLGFGAMPRMADPVNYVSRITLPVLMLGGERDYIFPLETSQRPLYRLLGTPDGHKRRKLYDAGHGPLPRAALIRESADWLDRYLGEVQ